MYVFLIIFPLEFFLPLTSISLLSGTFSFSGGLVALSCADFSSSSYLLNIALSQDSFFKIGFPLSVLNSPGILYIPRVLFIILSRHSQMDVSSPSLFPQLQILFPVLCWTSPLCIS